MSPPKTVLYLIVVGRGTPKQGNAWWGYAIRGEGHCMAEEPTRALREVERLTRNPENLANADGRCWKDTLGRRRSFKTSFAGLLTLPGEDWSPPGKRPRNSYVTNLNGLCQGGPEGENIQTLPGLVKRPKNKQKGSLEKSCESLIVGTADGREERRKRRPGSYSYIGHWELG